MNRIWFYTLVLAGFMIAQPVAAKDRAVYLNAGASSGFFSKSGSISGFLSFAEAPFSNASNAFSKVYWCVNNTDAYQMISEEPYSETIHQIISDLRSKNISADCVVDIDGWIVNKDMPAVLNYINTVFNFNNSAQNQSEAFVALQIIARPDKIMVQYYRNGVSNDEIRKVWVNYIEILREVRKSVDNYNANAQFKLKLSLALPSLYDSDEFDFTSFQEPINIVDEAVIFAESRVLSIIKSNCLPEASYCNSIGKPFSISVVGKKNGSDKDISFWGFTADPLGYMNQVLYSGLADGQAGFDDKISVETYFSNLANFSGVSIDGYEQPAFGGYQEILTSSTQPTNDNNVKAGSGGSDEANLSQGDYDYYLPGFINMAHSRSVNASIYIDLSSTSKIYDITAMDNDSQSYSAKYGPYAYQFGNNNDALNKNKMQPLEEGKISIKVNKANLPAKFVQTRNIYVNIIEQPNLIIPCIKNKRDASLLVNGVSNQLYYFIGRVDGGVPKENLMFEIYQFDADPSGVNVDARINVALTDLNKYLTMDDISFGSLLKDNDAQGPVSPLYRYDAANGVYVISGETVQVNGFAFDDAVDNLIKLRYKKNGGVFTDAVVSKTRMKNNINNYITYWGAGYQSGFTLDWKTEGLRGYYEINVLLDDGKPNHTVDLGNKKIYWNRKPEALNIAQPVGGFQQIYLDNENISNPKIAGSAFDPDNEVLFGAHISAVDFYLDNDSIKILSVSNNDAKDNDSSNSKIGFNIPWNSLRAIIESKNALGKRKFYAKAMDSFGLVLKSGEKDIDIKLNQAPDFVEITNPAAQADIVVNRPKHPNIISGEAIDSDVDLASGAYISSVEVYIDSPSNLIAEIKNNSAFDTDSDNGRIAFSFPWVQLDSSLLGQHEVYAVAKDSYGLVLESSRKTINIREFEYDPDTNKIEIVNPRIGSINGGNLISIRGKNLRYVSDVLFGGSDLGQVMSYSDTEVIVQVPMFNLSKYVDVSIKNVKSSPSVSNIKYDGYRYIHSGSTNIGNSNLIADIKYSNNGDLKLYVLNSDTSSIEVYDRDNGQSVVLRRLADISCAVPQAVPYKMDISKSGDEIFVIYNGSSVVNKINLQNNNISSMNLTNYNQGVYSTNAMSVSFMMLNKLLIGTTGNKSGLYMIDLDNESKSRLVLPVDIYNKVDVYANQNKSAAYILCSFFDLNDNKTKVDLYRFDAESESLSDSLLVNASMIDLSGVSLDNAQIYESMMNNVNELKIAVKSDGAEFVLYTKSAFAKFNKMGKLIGVSSYLSGADFAFYDSIRDILYSGNINDNYFMIRSAVNLNEMVSYFQYENNGKGSGLADIDWNANQMFMLTDLGINTISVGEIYPKIQIDDEYRFVNINANNNPKTKIQLRVTNSGNIESDNETDNDSMDKTLKLYVNNRETQYKVKSFTGDTHTLEILSPDNETSLKLRADVYGSLSSNDDVMMVSNILHLLPASDTADLFFSNGTQKFFPEGFFYDKSKSDLYIFDKGKAAGLTSIIRINVDTQTGVLIRKPVNIQVKTLANPIAIAKAGKYIMVVSEATQRIHIYDGDLFDSTGNAKVTSVLFANRLNNLSGLVGHPKSNIMYLWNDKNVLQITWTILGQLVVIRQNIVATLSEPYLTDVKDIYIDNDGFIDADNNGVVNQNDYSGYIACGSSNSVKVFNASAFYSSIKILKELPVNSGQFKITSFGWDHYVSLSTSNDIAQFIAPAVFGNILPVFSTSVTSPMYLAVDGDYIAFTGKDFAQTNTFSINVFDINKWDNFAYQDNQDILYRKPYTLSSSRKVRDAVIIKGRLFTTIDRNVYVVSFPDKNGK